MTKVSRAQGQQGWLLEEPRRRTMRLLVPVDKEHSARLNEKLAQDQQELVTLEDKKKAEAAIINKRLAELRESTRSILGQLRVGQTEQDVAVQDMANFDTGEAWTIRLDTNREVENSRRGLTERERAAMLRGPEAGTLEPARRRRAEGEDPDTEMDAAGEAAPAAVETALSPAEQQAVASTWHSPYQHPVVAAPGESVFQLPVPLESWCARWPSIGTEVSFYQLGAVMGSARWNDFGGVDQQGGWERSGDTARVLPEVLEVTSAAVLRRDFRQASRSELNASPPAETPPPVGTGVGQVLALPSLDNPLLEGWKLEVKEGVATLVSPPGERVGPLRWNASAAQGTGMADRIDTQVSDAWMDEVGTLVLPALDDLVRSGAITESFPGYRLGVLEPDSVPAASDEPTSSPVDEAPPSPGGLTEEAALELAYKLSDFGRKAIRVLATQGPMIADALRTAINTRKLGHVLNNLTDRSLVTESDKGLELTARGAAVAAALSSIPT